MLGFTRVVFVTIPLPTPTLHPLNLLYPILSTYYKMLIRARTEPSILSTYLCPTIYLLALSFMLGFTRVVFVTIVSTDKVYIDGLMGRHMKACMITMCAMVMVHIDMLMDRLAKTLINIH